MATYDLSKGADDFAKGLARQLPGLSKSELEKAADALLSTAGQEMADGGKLSVVKTKDGSTTITIFETRIRKKDDSGGEK